MTRIGPEQLQAPNRAKKSVRTCLNKVEQPTLDYGDTLVPDFSASVVDGSVPSPCLGCVQNFGYSFTQGTVFSPLRVNSIFCGMLEFLDLGWCVVGPA